MFGLEQKDTDFIINVLKKNIPDENAKFYIFGSRAKGTYRMYSDIDIAIDNNSMKLSADTLGKLLIIFKDSVFPYEVDIIDLNSIDENFKNLIKNDLVKIN